VARIGVDGLMISPDGKGHARSERHAVEALAARGEHDLVVFVREDVSLEGVEVVRVDDPLTVQWELFGVVAAARRHRLDAFLTLGDRLPLAGGPPFLVWLFEAPTHRIRANRASGAPARHLASDVVTSMLWKRSLRRAAHVAFGSKATSDEVLEMVSLDSTSIVYPGLPPGFSPGAHRDRGRYVVHLGSADPRDNTAVAVEACRLAGIRLLVVGGAAGDTALGDVEFLGRVSDDELVDLYRGARAYLDPSLYEGFGYGVLEAMACGAPVVASGVTSIPEVVGDAALLCDPRSPADFAEALTRVLDDVGLAATMRERGLARSRRFTWEETGLGLGRAIELVLQR
jgi:glycosyltransferase involved in cell wall biosynthesis